MRGIVHCTERIPSRISQDLVYFSHAPKTYQYKIRNKKFYFLKGSVFRNALACFSLTLNFISRTFALAAIGNSRFSFW